MNQRIMSKTDGNILGDQLRGMTKMERIQNEVELQSIYEKIREHARRVENENGICGREQIFSEYTNNCLEEIEKGLTKAKKSLIRMYKIDLIFLYIASLFVCLFISYAMGTILEKDSLRYLNVIFSFFFTGIVFSYFVYPKGYKIISKINKLKIEIKGLNS